MFEKMGVLRITGLSVAVGDAPDAQRQWLQAGWASPGLTDVFGVSPIMGRWFHADDREMGASSSAMDSGSGCSAAGPTSLVRRCVSMPGAGPSSASRHPDYRTLTPDLDLWIRSRISISRGASQPESPVHHVRPVASGRLARTGAGRPAIARVAARRWKCSMHRGWGLTIDSLREAYVGYLRQPVLVLQGAVFLLLLIACANVAGLLLAQAVARQKEMGLRSALGSSRTRILRQVLTENVLLSCVAGAVGIGAAWVGLRTLVNTGLSAYRDLQNVTLDWTVIAFALSVSLVTAVIFGILPALQLSRLDVVEVVRDAGRSTTAGPARSRLRDAFVVAQVALALVLLVGTGLLIRSLLRLNAVATGIEPAQLVAVQIPLPRSMYRNTQGNTSAGGLLVEFDSRFSDFTERVRERFSTVPGVESVAATTPPPLGGTPRRVLFRKDSWLSVADERDPWSAEWYPVSADHFETAADIGGAGSNIFASG